MSRLIFQQIICCCIVLQAAVSSASVYMFQPDKKLVLPISKSGLNRISNTPYKIIQVTGDDSQFRIKYDEDGSNIYFMPLSNVGESIEISIRNNAGHIQDLELNVANIKGQSIIINSKIAARLEKSQKSDIADMLRAMKDNVESKFYVQNISQKFDDIKGLKLKQLKIYRYKRLIGGVFEGKNYTKKPITFNIHDFAKRFDKVKSFYPEILVINPKQTIRLFIVQEAEEK